jgi:hypothetical protein
LALVDIASVTHHAVTRMLLLFTSRLRALLAFTARYRFGGCWRAQEGATSTRAEDSLAARYSRLSSSGCVSQLHVRRKQPPDSIDGKCLVATRDCFFVYCVLYMLAQTCRAVSMTAQDVAWTPAPSHVRCVESSVLSS